MHVFNLVSIQFFFSLRIRIEHRSSLKVLLYNSLQMRSIITQFCGVEVKFLILCSVSLNNLISYCLLKSWNYARSLNRDSTNNQETELSSHPDVSRAELSVKAGRTCS